MFWLAVTCELVLHIPLVCSRRILYFVGGMYIYGL